MTTPGGDRGDDLRVEILFDEPMPVHYGFVNLVHGEVDGDRIGSERTGQANGLCGAQVPGQLNLVTGLHTGEVPFRVEWWDAEPPVDDAWEEVVEAPYLVSEQDLSLESFEEFFEVHLPATGPHRARYSATGMDAGHELDTTDEDELAPDRYLLQLWPAAEAPDAVVRQTGEYAAYWHGVARGER